MLLAGTRQNALNLQQAVFERVAQEYEQAARDEVHVAGAQATEMSGAELRRRMGALENQTEQTWTSHRLVSWHEMNSVASDALENQRKSSLSEATAGIQRNSRQSREHLQENQQSGQRHLSKVCRLRVWKKWKL